MPKLQNTIRVLIVDDSPLVRDMIRAILDSDPGICVVGEAENGVEAIDKAVTLKPDLVTMDIEMPIMGGLEAIEKIIARRPVPILVITALTGVRTAFSAITRGALDVIEKPDISFANMESLLRKVHYLAKVNVVAHRCQADKKEPGSIANRISCPKIGIVAIAASTGGPQALHSILSRLPATFPVPIVISQHISEGFTQGMVDWLGNASTLPVTVAVNGEMLVPGHVYVNPAEYSMKITEQGMIILSARIAGQIYQPSCNTLLASVAAAYKKGAIGLIMSGMGDDGVAGMQAIKLAGGATLAQDAASSVVFGMNGLAIERGFIHKVVTLDKIPAELIQRAGG